MNPIRYRFFATVGVIAVILQQGCSSVPRYAAEEVHQTIAAPGFSSEIHATGIEKTTLDDGSVVRKADSLTHTTTILGFSRTANYKGAELETIDDD
jgi:hypothetical protein